MRKLMTMKYPFNFFMAPDGGSAGSGGDGGSGAQGSGSDASTENGGQNNQNNHGNDGSGNKTFTQEDINRIAAREKAEGRRALLKELGIEDTDDARNAVKEYLAQQESNKTDLQKANDKATKAEKAKIEAEAKATVLQQKFDAIADGANPATVDDLIALVRTKMNDKTDFKAALQIVKKAYPVFYNGQQNNANVGTGGNTNHSRNGGSGTSLGERLAKSRMNTTTTESPFFKKSF